MGAIRWLSIKYKLLEIVPKVLTVVSLLAMAALVLLLGLNSFRLEISPIGASQITLDYGQEYVEPGAEGFLRGSIFLREGIPLRQSIAIQGDVNTARAGSYTVTYSGKFFFWSGTAQRTVYVIDRDKPEITLSHDPEHFTLPGAEYREEGFSAYDAHDGDLTDKVTREQRGAFVTYRVSDSSGNETWIRRKIRFHDPYAPEITLQGDVVMHMQAGFSYADPGFAAQDNPDGDITDRVTVTGKVDPYRAGTYVLTYDVLDSFGNSATATRSVIVEPKEQPTVQSPQGKVIYLTFDDGPGPDTERLLDILKKYDVKATFFVVDSGYPHLIRRMAQEGHSVGIHSVTHDYRAIYESADAFFGDLQQMQSIIEEATGQRTTLMRFPGGSSNTVSRFNPGIMTYLTQAVTDMGLQYFDWNVDSDDAGRTKDTETVLKNVIKGVEARRVSVVLQHDVKPYSVDAVEQIILWALENGYTFLPLTPGSPTAHHGVNN